MQTTTITFRMTTRVGLRESQEEWDGGTQMLVAQSVGGIKNEELQFLNGFVATLKLPW